MRPRNTDSRWQPIGTCEGARLSAQPQHHPAAGSADAVLATEPRDQGRRKTGERLCTCPYRSLDTPKAAAPYRTLRPPVHSAHAQRRCAQAQASTNAPPRAPFSCAHPRAWVTKTPGMKVPVHTKKSLLPQRRLNLDVDLVGCNPVMVRLLQLCHLRPPGVAAHHHDCIVDPDVIHKIRGRTCP